MRHWYGFYRCLHFIVHYSALSNEISVEPTDFWLEKVCLTCGLWVGVDVARYSIHQLLRTYLWLLRGEWRALRKSGVNRKEPVFLVFNTFDPRTLFLLPSSWTHCRICMCKVYICLHAFTHTHAHVRTHIYYITRSC